MSEDTLDLGIIDAARQLDELCGLMLADEQFKATGQQRQILLSAYAHVWSAGARLAHVLRPRRARAPARRRPRVSAVAAARVGVCAPLSPPAAPAE